MSAQKDFRLGNNPFKKENKYGLMATQYFL
jgi:hypothetical protein